MFKYIVHTQHFHFKHLLHRVKSSNIKLRSSIKSEIDHLKTATEIRLDNQKNETPVCINEKTIALLEQLSLVDCANKESIKVLEDAIKFANKILDINTDGVAPMYTVLENRYLNLRKDEVTDGNCQKSVLANASLIEEDYFIAPPGNIPLQPREDLLHNSDKVKT